MSSSTINLLLQQAVELHRSGRVDEAVRTYKKVLRKDARAIGVLNLLGLAEFQLGHLAEAADALTRAARLNPDLPNIDYNLGRVLQAQERFEDALVHYQKAVAKAPQDAEALSNLGTVLAALKRSDEAIAYYQRAVSLDPRHGDAWFNLGNALKAAERYDEAFTAYSQVLTLRPEYTAAVGSLVYVLCRLDRHREAIEYARRIIAVEPSDAGHHMNLANALAVVGRDEEALIAYDTALALDPVWSDILWNKGLFFLSRGRFAEGWPLYEERWRV
ncbi:MAG TPA: tetratricopeptide repeat protein, partial [Pseudolabrys sp.]|nr:tetratricopeptide repeat protein [Pseudolabrys sp.]